jgi:hypothetical protein
MFLPKVQAFELLEPDDDGDDEAEPSQSKRCKSSGKPFAEQVALIRTAENATSVCPAARRTPARASVPQYVFPSEPQCLVRDTVEVLNRLREMRGRVQDQSTLPPCAPIMPTIMATLPENQPEPTGNIQANEHSPETAHKVGR